MLKLLHFFALLVCVTFPVRGQTLNDQVKQRLVHEIKSFKTRNRLTSISFSVFHGRDETFDYATGYANVARRLKTSPDHIYTLASVTKALTGALTIYLVSQGQLAFEDSVFNYIEGFPKNVTVLDLLNHTSGFLREKENEKYLANSSYQDVVKYLPIQFKRKIHRYANFNYGALGAVIEKATRQRFADVMRSYFFQVTGERLSFSNHPDQRSSALLVKNYVRKHRRWLLHHPVEFGLWEPAAFAQTSSRALAKFLRHHMKPKFLKLLESKAVTVRKRIDKNGSRVEECYAMGYRLRYVDGDLRYVYHNGFLYGVLSTMYYFPHKDVGFVALSNMSSYPRQTLTLGGVYRGVESIVDFDFNKRLADFTAENGYLEGAVYYETVRHDGELVERYLEEFARGYLEENKVAEALNILKLNAYAFPESAKSYENLAEAYLKTGYHELAVENLKKSLRIDPNLRSSRELLEEIVTR